MVDEDDVYNPAEPPKNFVQRIRRGPHVVEPSIVAQVRDEVKLNYVCPHCKASRRADVFYRHDISEGREIAVEIECRAFKDGKKCGNVETRYYNR